MVIRVSNVAILLFIVMVVYFIYTSIFNSFKEGMKGKKNCSNVCKKPKEVSGKCEKKIFKDKNTANKKRSQRHNHIHLSDDTPGSYRTNFRLVPRDAEVP